LTTPEVAGRQPPIFTQSGCIKFSKFWIGAELTHGTFTTTAGEEPTIFNRQISTPSKD